jgi:hypothetical protein
MTYLLIIAGVCSLTCILFITRLILKDTKETPPTLPVEPYVFKHVEELKNKTIGITYETKEESKPVEDFNELILLDLTGLSPRAKKAIASAGLSTIADLNLELSNGYLRVIKGVGPKTLTEINAWSEANYGVKIID